VYKGSGRCVDRRNGVLFKLCICNLTTIRSRSLQMYSSET
jgi:hypothetical protein